MFSVSIKGDKEREGEWREKRRGRREERKRLTNI